MFIGQLDGNNIVGYLDSTDLFYYFDGFGHDADASFVCFDVEGSPLYRIMIRVDSNTKPGIYNVNTKVIDYVSVDIHYNEETCRFNDYYRIVEGATDWIVQISEINLDKGIVRGAITGTLLPSRYNSSPYTIPYKKVLDICTNIRSDSHTRPDNYSLACRGRRKPVIHRHCDSVAYGRQIFLGEEL